MSPVPEHVFRVPIPLRWSDLDAFNHVNNARYLTFVEQARIEWLETIGEPWVTDEYGPVLAQTLLNYKLPIEYPASIFVELFTAKLGNSSVTIGHRIVDQQDESKLYSDGNVVVVWMDTQTGHSAPLPAAIRAVFGDHADRLAVSSTKAMHGHLIGGTGAVELLACIMALRDGVIAPTIGYQEADPECALDVVPNEAREAKVDDKVKARKGKTVVAATKGGAKSRAGASGRNARVRVASAR